VTRVRGVEMPCRIGKSRVLLSVPAFIRPSKLPSFLAVTISGLRADDHLARRGRSILDGIVPDLASWLAPEDGRSSLGSRYPEI
jgi:hypothetical protein